MNCLNCGQAIDKNYCSNCGQKTSTKQFSLKHLFDYAVLTGMFDFNKGILHTIKGLFTRPGHCVREYLQGKRANYFNAFSFLLVSMTVMYFLDQYSGLKLADVVATEDTKGFVDNFEKFTKDFPRLIYLLYIPLMAVSSYLSFRKSKFNFAEHIVLNTFNSSAQIILSLPFLILTVFYKDKAVLSIGYKIFSYLLFVYSFWLYYGFFSKSNYRKISLIIRSLLAVIFFIIIPAITVAAILLIMDIG